MRFIYTIYLSVISSVWFCAHAQSFDRVVFAETGGTGITANGEYLSFTIGQIMNGLGTNASGFLSIGYQQADNIGSLLPVTWLGGQVMWQENHARVIWWVENEVNNERFSVERSMDGQIFKPVGEVFSHSPDPEYEFIDQDAGLLQSSQIFYRIKQIDIDGQFSYSSIMVLKNDNLNKLQGMVFPNPSTGKIWYRHQGNSSTGLVFKLFDIRGRLVWQNTFDKNLLSNDILLDLKNVGIGMYLLQMQASNQQKTFRIQIH